MNRELLIKEKKELERKLFGLQRRCECPLEKKAVADEQDRLLDRWLDIQAVLGEFDFSSKEE